MISVIIPYYNPDSNPLLEHLLGRAVKSALAQNVDIEVIVVDDGSPNPPRSIIGELGDSHARLLEAPHGRLGAARNHGIEASRGDVLAFLDADDYYFEGTLKPCLECMLSHEADLLGFGFRICSSEECDAPQPATARCTEPVTGNRYMIGNTPYGSSCMYLISRNLICDNSLRFAEGTYMEDEDFTPRLLFFSRRFVQCNVVTYAYCRRKDSITTSPMYDERAANTLNVLSRLQKFMSDHEEDDCRGLERKIRFLAVDHLRNTMRRPDWRKALPLQTEALHNLGLWPLQDAPYGLGYRIFVALSGTAAGRKILHMNEKRYRE